MTTLLKSGVTPELGEVIRTVMDSVLMDLCVCLPGKIVKYNSATQYADVQVQLLQEFQDGSTETYPIIPNVPVKHPRAMGGNAFVHMPLTPGDDVVIVFSQRSLDNWKTQGGIVNPDDSRKHHLTDAYALIGGSAIPNAFKPKTKDAIEITNGSASIEVHPDGKFKITNGTNELIDLFDQLLKQLAVDTTNTIFGPMKLNGFTVYQELATKVETLKEG